MSVVVVTHMRGDPRELSRAEEAFRRALRESGHELDRPPGLQARTLARSASGLLTVEEWDSEESFRRAFEDPVVVRARADAGLPLADVEVAQTLRRTAPAAAGGWADAVPDPGAWEDQAAPRDS